MQPFFEIASETFNPVHGTAISNIHHNTSLRISLNSNQISILKNCSRLNRVRMDIFKMITLKKSRGKNRHIAGTYATLVFFGSGKDEAVRD